MRIFYDNEVSNFVFLYIKKAFIDLKTPKMIFLSVLPCLFGLAVCAIFLFFSITNFSFYLGQFPNIWVEYALAYDTFFSKISYFLLYFFAIVSLILCGIIILGISNVLVCSCLSGFVVSFVVKKHYPFLSLNPPNFIESTKASTLIFASSFFKFALWSGICYALGFIGLGFIGLILNIFVYYKFFSLNINYEIALNIMPQKLLKSIISQYSLPISMLNIIIFIPLYIPILNLFILVWQMLVLSHFMLDIYQKEMKNSTEVIEIKNGDSNEKD